MSSSSLDEKEKEIVLNDPQTAAVAPKEYESIKIEPKVAGGEKDVEANSDKHPSRGALFRFQSGTSAISDASSDITDSKRSIGRKKKWYKRANPLKWGAKPPVPKEKSVCPEFVAGFFSRLTFQWMHPLMVVSIFSQY